MSNNNALDIIKSMSVIDKKYTEFKYHDKVGEYVQGGLDNTNGKLYIFEDGEPVLTKPFKSLSHFAHAHGDKKRPIKSSFYVDGKSLHQIEAEGTLLPPLTPFLVDWL